MILRIIFYQGIQPFQSSKNNYSQGAAYASMTGSGSTVFGIFDNEIELKEAFAEYSVWQGKM